MKIKIFLLAIFLVTLSTSCEKWKYHVYSIEIVNSTDTEMRFVTQVKMGADTDAFLAPGHDTLLYTERRMSKDFDGPAAFLSEYYSTLSFYFTGVQDFVLISDVSDPLGLRYEYNYFVHDAAWDFEIRDVRVPDKGWPDEQYYYTINISEDKLSFSLKK